TDGNVFSLAIRSLNEERTIFGDARLPTVALDLNIQVGISDSRSTLLRPERHNARLERPEFEGNSRACLYMFENCDRLDSAGFQIPDLGLLRTHAKRGIQTLCALAGIGQKIIIARGRAPVREAYVLAWSFENDVGLMPAQRI